MHVRRTPCANKVLVKTKKKTRLKNKAAKHLLTPFSNENLVEPSRFIRTTRWKRVPLILIVHHTARLSGYK